MPTSWAAIPICGGNERRGVFRPQIGCVLRPRLADVQPLMERRSAHCRSGFQPLTNGLCPRRSGALWASRAGKGPCGTRPVWPVSRSDNVRRELLRRLPCPPAAVLPPAGLRLRPVGRRIPDICPAALRRRRTAGKGPPQGGLTRASARTSPRPLIPRPRKMHVRVQRRAKKARSGPRGAVSTNERKH